MDGLDHGITIIMVDWDSSFHGGDQILDHFYKIAKPSNKLRVFLSLSSYRTLGSSMRSKDKKVSEEIRPSSPERDGAIFPIKKEEISWQFLGYLALKMAGKKMPWTKMSVPEFETCNLSVTTSFSAS